MGKRKQTEITLTEDQAFVVGQLEAVKTTLDELVGVAVAAVESEIDGAVKTHDELYAVATNSVVNVLGDAAETLRDLDQLVDTIQGLASETVATANGRDSTNGLGVGPFQGFPTVDDYLAQPGAMTFKQRLWLSIRQWWASYTNLSLLHISDPIGKSEEYVDDIRRLETARGLPHLTLPTSPGQHRIVSIQIPADDAIVIRDINGMVIM